MARVTHNKVESVRFHSFLNTTINAGAPVQALINPTLSGHLQTIGDTFELYRFTELWFRLQAPATANQGGGTTAAYLPGVTDTYPTTATTNLESLNGCYLSVRATVPTEWVRLNRKDLSGYQPWYKTVQGTPEVADEVQGVINFTGSSSDVVLCEFRGVVEFKNPVNAASTPAERRAKALEMQRKKLLSILASPAETSTLGKPKGIGSRTGE